MLLGLESVTRFGQHDDVGLSHMNKPSELSQG